jgi:Fur family ferric uptake transcriptional regulator
MTSKRHDFETELLALGLRRTRPRLAVLQRLAQLHSPVSHGELASMLEPLDRATVYRTLIDLTGAGLVARQDLGDHVWRFALVQKDELEHARRHPHLLCSDCHSVVCLPDVKVTRGHKRVADMEVQLKGLCDDCAH